MDAEKEDFILEDLCDNHPIKILNVTGANATPKVYGWLKTQEYHWLSLPEIVSFPVFNDIDGNKLIQLFNNHRTKQLPIKTDFVHRYKSVDLLFNTFLYTLATKHHNETSETEFFKPNGFFDTYILHNPEFGIVDAESGTVLLSKNPMNGKLSSKFEGILRVDGIDGIGWTIGYFKAFQEHQMIDLFGSSHHVLKDRLKDNSHPRGNYLQGDFPHANKKIFSPLSMTNADRGFSLETFQFFNHDGVTNPAWAKRSVLYPVMKLDNSENGRHNYI